jgi:hypothetical protein
LKPACSRTAKQKGGRIVETVEYQGWKNNLRMSNGTIELIATLEVGPRILCYRLLDGKNVLAQFANQLGKSGEADWMVRGGHRLWTSPEDLTRTYAPDNRAVTAQEIAPGTIRLTQSPDEPYGVQKEIDLRLADQGSEVTLLHRITNVGTQPTTLAPWALTVMAPGGLAIIPLPEKKPHPGSPKNAQSPADFAPNQNLVLWPYTDLSDPRFTFASRYITLRQDPGRGPTKLGVNHTQGWVAYHLQGTLFVKRIGHEQGKTYPDRGCNLETFTNQEILEVEHLGPLVELKPMEKVELQESWELYKDIPEPRSEEEIDRHIRPLVQGSGR